MNLSLTKKILLSVLGLGVVGSLVGMGTFASFNAVIENNANTFQTGTIVISTNDGTTQCYSTTDGAAGSAPNTTTTTCASKFTLTSAKPGEAKTGTLTIKNHGTLPATVQLTSASCVDAAADTPLNSGIGSLCASNGAASVQFYMVGDNGTPQCVYGHTTCTTFDASKTLAGFLGSTPVSLNNAAGTATTWTADTAQDGSGDDVQYTFGFMLPDSGTAGAENAYQGRKATITLTWTATQTS